MYEKELRLDKDSEGIEEDLSKTVSQGANENPNSSETKTQAESQTEQEPDKDYEKEIKKKIEGILKDKIENSNFWTKEQLEQAKNIVNAQINTTVDYIYDMAQKRIDSQQYDKRERKYFKKLEKESVKIAKYEARVNPQFDMEAAIRKEQEIKAKVEQGELTPEEALKAYSEPIPELGGGMLRSLSRMGVKTYEDIYRDMNSMESNNDKAKKFIDELREGAPSLEEQALNSRKIQEKFAEIDKSRSVSINQEHDQWNNQR